MGTKLNPSNYDCYDKAKEDAPMFVLLARDPLAPILVDLWASLREQQDDDSEIKQIIEAHHCAYAMRKWRTLSLL